MIAFLLVMAGVWLFGLRIRDARFVKDNREGTKFLRRFRIGAATAVVPAFLIGTLYRLHVLSRIVAIPLYIPVVLYFIWGLRWLQPYLHEAKEETDHDGS